MNEINNTFKASCIQFNPILNEREKNIEALLNVVIEAAQNEAKLIITPEMATTGYYYKNREAISPFVDTIPGRTTARFEEIAKSFHTYIVIGMPEIDKETELYYNSAALIGPYGYIGKYRKVHLWESEAHWSALGDLGVPVFETEIGNIAINICMDSIFFESSRLAAVQGANILAFPTNSSAQSVFLLQARAETNGLYVLSANRSNSEKGFHMIGASAIWSPLGEKLEESPHVTSLEQPIDEPTIIYSIIDKALYQNAGKARLQERKPDCYKEIMQYIAPWDFTKSKEKHKITAAILQCESINMSKEENFSKHKRLVHEAIIQSKVKEQPLLLAVLPELVTTGSLETYSIEKIRDLAEQVNSDFMKQYQQLAKDEQVYLVLGFLEKDSGHLYNSSILINDYGDVLGLYRKMHLTKDEKRWATAGSKLEVFETEKLGRVGLLIGYDAAFPEASRILAIKRADTIIIPSNWSGEFGRSLEMNKNISLNLYPEGALSTWDSIALSSQAYMIVANSINTNQLVGGRSGLYTIDPLYGLDQPVIASTNMEEIIIVNYETLHLDWWFNQEKLITLRQTKEYKPLVI
ncbi:nitrilase-related carbon-nitrogen hydrolase [Paenisporosarcina sp. TG-14]|uniref:nitrilase-related carbon-nitrogen hydrolase n=1 Tax=Paenisporosarcina sp. TG-14 TaxID=1231057 RepID=UPI0002FD5CDB|nr:nitrilase-related carbon-nitrogen hydrolase [Paenisporosarcina sp. TG-14]